MDFNELNAALSGMDPAELALGAGFAAIIVTLMAVGGLVWFFLSAIGYFKMFQKAGQRSWFAFIPLLREYALFKMAWTVKAFVISIVMLVALQISGMQEGLILSLLGTVCGIVWIVMQIKLVIRVAKSFGKDGVWALLLFVVPFITTLILGFGSAQYVGNGEALKDNT